MHEEGDGTPPQANQIQGEEHVDPQNFDFILDDAFIQAVEQLNEQQLQLEGGQGFAPPPPQQEDQPHVDLMLEEGAVHEEVGEVHEEGAVHVDLMPEEGVGEEAHEEPGLANLDHLEIPVDDLFQNLDENQFVPDRFFDDVPDQFFFEDLHLPPQQDEDIHPRQPPLF